MICQRCAKEKNGIHTCTPSEFVQELEARVAALTKERDEIETECAVHAACTKHRFGELAAAQAVNEKLREALQAFCEKPINGFYLEQQCAIEALAIPSDTTALQQRLAEERERCAKYLEDHPTMLIDTLVAAIRSMK